MGMDGGELAGKICLVTGSGRGIGAAIARAAADQGAGVVIHYRHSAREASALLSELETKGTRALAVQAGVGDERAVDAMFSLVEQKMGTVDLLVNNAGISLRKLITDTSIEDWYRVMDTNLKGVFLCSRRAVSPMIRQRYGRIVNIASIWGLHAGAMESVYAASKGGVVALSKSLATELGPSGITVNAICPGPVETALLKAELDTGELEALAVDLPLGRLASPGDVAELCAFLLSERAAYINGQVITLDGGWKA